MDGGRGGGRKGRGEEEREERREEREGQGERQTVNEQTRAATIKGNTVGGDGGREVKGCSKRPIFHLQATMDGTPVIWLCVT